MIALSLLPLVILTRGSWEKDEAVEDPLESAKSWHINSISKLKIAHKNFCRITDTNVEF